MTRSLTDEGDALGCLGASPNQEEKKPAFGSTLDGVEGALADD